MNLVGWEERSPFLLSSIIKCHYPDRPFGISQNVRCLRLQMTDRPFLLFLKKGRSISSTQPRPDRSFCRECFCRKGRSPFIYTRCQKSDRPFGISQNVRSLFGYFWLYGKGDRSFVMERSIALLGMERSRSLYFYFSMRGRSPFSICHSQERFPTG